jgi:hypothetical protein
MEEAIARLLENGIGALRNSDPSEILTPNEAGAIFGVSGWAMYKRAKNGTAPGHYMGKKLYFIKHELIAAVQKL